ncbi:hypothetical protein SAMN05216243_0084 [Sediminibacillus albus]|uniref:Uncharacterized protein n=1 Tax=Sediminibacillus albus TaxID=407036 RepID=A0A1G8VFW1_9BACI|nr:hypothetical protein SAMN05216243_0084 [Sediminibacillus albus]
MRPRIAQVRGGSPALLEGRNIVGTVFRSLNEALEKKNRTDSNVKELPTPKFRFYTLTFGGNHRISNYRSIFALITILLSQTHSLF